MDEVLPIPEVDPGRSSEEPRLGTGGFASALPLNSP